MECAGRGKVKVRLGVQIIEERGGDERISADAHICCA